MDWKYWLNYFLGLIYGSAVDASAEPKGADKWSVGAHLDLGSGYSVEEEMEKKVKRLEAACLDVLTDEDFVSRDITGDDIPETFCNQAVQYVARVMGYYDFSKEDTANEMVSKMRALWKIVGADEAIAEAKRGSLVVAGKEYKTFGHVATVFPISGKFSGSWGHIVPVVAHVGMPPNELRKTSAAFPVSEGEPDYFLCLT